MATNLFAAAKSVAPAKPAKKGKTEIAVPGVKLLAMMDAAMKAIEGVRKTTDAAVKDFCFNQFMQLSKAAGGARPDSFKGTEGDATTSAELRKRSTLSTLGPAEVEYLESKKIPVGTDTKVQKLFGINPAYAENEELLAKVSAALADIVPEDFIVLQEGKTTRIVTDDTIAAAFKSGDEQAIRMVTVQANKPALATAPDLKTLFAELGEMLADE